MTTGEAKKLSPSSRHAQQQVSRRLSNGFRSRQLLEAIELSADEVQGVGSAANAASPKPREALLSVARIKLMAIAKRNLRSSTGSAGDNRTQATPNGVRKDARSVLRRLSNHSDPKAAAKDSGSSGAEVAAPVEQRRHRVGTFETGDGATWKATVQGDIEKFMFPSLRLEALYAPSPSASKAASASERVATTSQPSPSPDQVEKLLATNKMTVEWEMQPRSMPRTPASPQADSERGKRSAFDRKLEAAEALLCEQQYDETLLMPRPIELEVPQARTEDAPAPAPAPETETSLGGATAMYLPDVVATPQLIPRLPQTRRIIKQIQRHSTQQGQIEYYADKRNLFAKWKTLQRSQQHRLPTHRRSNDSDSDSDASDDQDDAEEEEEDQPLGELSPRSLFFHECTRHQILPEPIFSRINDVQRTPASAAASFPSVAASLVRSVRDRGHAHDLDGLAVAASGRVTRRRRQLALHLQQFGLGDAKTRALAASLERFHSVHVLDLSANRLTDAAVIPLLVSLERAATVPLKPLASPVSSTTRQDAADPAVAHRPRLSEIIARVGLPTLSDSTARGCALTTLNLSQNAIGRAGYEQIARFLACCRALTHLDLSRTNVASSGSQDDALAPLTRAIQSHPALRVVNLSDNRIGERGGELLGEMLTHPACRVAELDVTWNGICRRGAVAIGEALRANTTLRSLRLGMNRCGDEGGEQLAAALATNAALTALDLSRNALGGATCIALGVFLRANRSLRTLQLRDNSLGPVGCRALLRAISMGCACEIDMSVHDAGSNHEACGDDANAIFDAAFPSLSSPFELHLGASPYQFAVACELLDAATLYRRCSLSDVVYMEPQPAPATARKKPAAKRTALIVDVEGRCLREASGGKAWTLPSTGVLCATAKFTPPDVSRLVSIAPPVSISSEPNSQPAPYLFLIRAIQRGTSPREVSILLDLGLHDLFLTTRQAGVFLAHLAAAMDPIEVLGRLWPCLSDGEQAFELLRAHLPQPADQRRLMDAFGISTIQFSTANPTGHWSLDLSDPQQRKMAVWFAVLNAADARVVAELHAKRTDPSQYGRGYYWRNVRFNRKPIRLAYDFFDRLPRSGVLEFDYASPVRHEDVAAPTELSDEELAALVKLVGAEVCSVYMPVHKRKDLKYQLALFHLAIAGRFISSRQAHFVLQHYPKSIENCRLRILLAVHKMLVDLENFGELLDRLGAPDRPRVYHALGYLNTINPLAVDMDYDVDFEREDEKMLLRALVDLSMASTMDVIRIDSERSTVLVIYSMYQTNSVPASGRICFRYVSHQSAASGAVSAAATPSQAPAASTAASSTAPASVVASASVPSSSLPLTVPAGRQDWLRARQQIYRYFLCGDRLRALGDAALALSACSPAASIASGAAVAGVATSVAASLSPSNLPPTG